MTDPFLFSKSPHSLYFGMYDFPQTVVSDGFWSLHPDNMSQSLVLTLFTVTFQVSNTRTVAQIGSSFKKKPHFQLSSNQSSIPQPI